MDNGNLLGNRILVNFPTNYLTGVSNHLQNYLSITGQTKTNKHT